MEQSYVGYILSPEIDDKKKNPFNSCISILVSKVQYLPLFIALSKKMPLN